jgi:hypothetical protein
MIPDNIEKLKTSQYLRFIDTTPTASAPTWKVVGIGVEEMSTSFSPQVDTIKWIIEDSARNDHTSNQKQSSVTQKAYKNDPCFEFVNAGRDKLNYTTHILEVDTWSGTSGSYAAKMSDGLITVTEYSGEEISYDLYFDGDPTDGTVALSGGVPTFTPTASL